MRRPLKHILTLILGGAMVVSLSACSFFETNKRNPYDVAESLGQVETGDSEANWLAQLHEGSIGGADTFTLAVNRALVSSVTIVSNFHRSGETTIFGELQDTYTSMGSGVFYSVDRDAGDAYIVTNYHVIYSEMSKGDESIPHISDDITVYLYGGIIQGREIKATFLGGAMHYDIAVLKVENSDILKDSSSLPIVAGDSDGLAVGERVFTVGNPDGEGFSVTSGILSVDAEYVDILSSDNKETVNMLEIRTDAPINHGNSGGGLYAADGRLVGIVNARSERSGVVNFGYAIPANLALAVAQNVIDNSKANDSRGALCAMLGITVQVSDSKSVYNEENGRTYIMQTLSVIEVTMSGKAFGKLREGDVIYSIQVADGDPVVVTRMHHLTVELLNVRKGDTVEIVFSRGGDTLSTQISYLENSDFTVYN